MNLLRGHNDLEIKNQSKANSEKTLLIHAIT